MAENKNAQQVREITDKLEQGIKELFESERFKEYLRTMSKFYNYSFNNTLLIAMQKPEATYVAGYTSWQRNFDRQVMKGEKGIKILAPAPYKAQEEREKIDPVTQKPVIGADGKAVTETVEVLRPAFKVVSVFDVSQTDGKELPDIIVDELKGTVENYEAFFDALKQESPVPISFEDIPGGAKGFFSPVESRIAIQEGMSEIQTVKTAIHEIAHAKLHAVKPDEKAAPEDKKDRHTKEVEAESVAYTVCQRYGIETSDYSFGYIAGWSSGKETKELKSSLDTIRKTAAEMIEGIDAKLKVLLAEKAQSAEKDAEAPAKEAVPEEQRKSPFTARRRITPMKPVSWKHITPLLQQMRNAAARLKLQSAAITLRIGWMRMLPSKVFLSNSRRSASDMFSQIPFSRRILTDGFRSLSRNGRRMLKSVRRMPHAFLWTNAIPV